MKGQRPIVIITFLGIKFCTAGIIYFVNEHSTAVLRCPFKAASWYGPPNHTLYTIATQVNQQLSQTDRLNVNGSEYDLLISNVQHADAGEYRCTGTNNGASISSYIQLVLTDAPGLYPTIQQIPAGSIMTGDTIRLTCTVSGGNPLPTLSWNCSGISINNTSGDTAAYSVMFTVDKTFNNKICTCSATHPVSSYRPNVQHTLVVYYAPDLYPKYNQIPAGSITAGHTIRLTCTVPGGC
ncbi:Hypothetical predicted protein [Mytilus galloprovincialis]|uniref:Ig-like domain-containing protein n=1 Tax=Mytilus galloprovincialis TaxID=29158 RepID=A0A8B6CTN1_MYTGA|nr:Hypothetical predicted protein [Mytilus galloprovincialis]